VSADASTMRVGVRDPWYRGAAVAAIGRSRPDELRSRWRLAGAATTIARSVQKKSR